MVESGIGIGDKQFQKAAFLPKLVNGPSLVERRVDFFIISLLICEKEIIRKPALFSEEDIGWANPNNRCRKKYTIERVIDQKKRDSGRDR
jgi:hypothetical protein